MVSGSSTCNGDFFFHGTHQKWHPLKTGYKRKSWKAHAARLDTDHIRLSIAEGLGKYGPNIVFPNTPQWNGNVTGAEFFRFKNYFKTVSENISARMQADLHEDAVSLSQEVTQRYDKV